VTAAMLLLAWLVHRYVERPAAPLMRRALLREQADVPQELSAASQLSRSTTA
jgi:peptidoglycan/LPS O-acetylase OafA/YrhL